MPRNHRFWPALAPITLCLAIVSRPLSAAVREENFDRAPANWEGFNNRSTAFESRNVTQDFGHSAATNNAGGERGEIGGRINPAGEAAYYGYRLPKSFDLNSSMSAEGKLYVARGAGHCLLGFFNANTLNGWRTPNTLVARINGRGDTFHCHLEYCTSRWRAEAGVVGEIVRGQRITPMEIASGRAHTWKMIYEPKTNPAGAAMLTFTLDGTVAHCQLLPEHQSEGITVTHFGLLPVLKTWDNPGEIWIDDLVINGIAFDFAQEPRWDAFRNRRAYKTDDTRPRFDFGWSSTHHAQGRNPGELGGLVFRGDCRDGQRMACYGDRLDLLTLRHPIEARGKVCVLRAISDSTASLGFYHSAFSMQSNRSQKESIPNDYLGINIEGPSSEGFFFYPVYRAHDQDGKALGHDGGKSPRIFPDGKVHDWFLRYDPAAANGNGQIVVGLDNQTCILDLAPGSKGVGATFDRFGICTPWIDGNSVTLFFDDLAYTSSQ